MAHIRVDAPYPNPQIKYNNPYYAKILSHAFAGPHSEFTMAAQLMNGHFLAEEYPEVSEVLSDMAQCDLQHFRLLGKTLTALGKPPTYAYDCNGQRHFWSGKDVIYKSSLCNIIQTNLECKEFVLAEYCNMLKLICDPQIVGLLNRLKEEEELHITVLKDLFQKYVCCNK